MIILCSRSSNIHTYIYLSLVVRIFYRDKAWARTEVGWLTNRRKNDICWKSQPMLIQTYLHLKWNGYFIPYRNALATSDCCWRVWFPTAYAIYTRSWRAISCRTCGLSSNGIMSQQCDIWMEHIFCKCGRSKMLFINSGDWILMLFE